MLNRWMDVGLFTAGVVIGVVLTGLRPEPVVSAQGLWQCRSFALEAKDTADVVGPWLGAAAHVEVATAGLEVAGQYALVACRQ